MNRPHDILSFDVIVVGGGHAGCEAALAAARMGLTTLMITLNLDKIALMPCNPAVGGVGKGQLTREIDALGGEQGRNTDRSFIQMKMLNTGKGPAVRALRAQTDKKLYEDSMKKTLINEPGLRLLEGNVARLLVSRETIEGVCLTDGTKISAKSVVLTCGTFLRGKIVIGNLRFPAGRMGEPPADELSASLREYGLQLGRFQSATPPRIDGRSIDFSRLQADPGDPEPELFSLLSERQEEARLSCYLTYTSATTHAVVRQFLHLSPIKTGSVSGKGPRYCPSIDRKVINFPDRDRHPVFVEPEGSFTSEYYLQGLTTSLPVWVQERVIQATPGLEGARLVRPGYAVEYDYVIPSQLRLSLETRAVNGLFLAGQINGTSGYEEAAAQGLIAGINASLRVKGDAPVVLKRSEAYIGVLIDDLVTKNVDEPYRMFTSRAEYRLLLRHDNAHDRLSPLGHRLGLVDDTRLASVKAAREAVDSLIGLLSATRIQPGNATDELLDSAQSARLGESQTAAQLLRRPELSISILGPLLQESLDRYDARAIARAEIEIKYSGYIERQLQDIARREKLEDTPIPGDFEYEGRPGLTIEARQKLSYLRPMTVGQASRIAGVSPADISVLLLYLRAAN